MLFKIVLRSHILFMTDGLDDGTEEAHQTDKAGNHWCR